MLMHMGRPRKGDRVAIAAKPERPFAEVLQHNATLLGMSYGDYLVYLAATQLDMPEYAPQPTKSLETLDGLLPEGAPAGIAAAFAHRPVANITNSEELHHRIAS
jgi:hypothetical protein